MCCVCACVGALEFDHSAVGFFSSSFIQIGPTCDVTNASVCSSDSITTATKLGLLSQLFGVSKAMVVSNHC